MLIGSGGAGLDRCARRRIGEWIINRKERKERKKAPFACAICVHRGIQMLSNSIALPTWSASARN